MYLYVCIYIYITPYPLHSTLYPLPSTLGYLLSLYPLPLLLPLTLTHSLTRSLEFSGVVTKTPPNYVDNPWGDPNLLNRPYPGTKLQGLNFAAFFF